MKNHYLSYKRLELIKHHPNTTRYSDPIKPRLAPMLWSSNGRPPSGGIRTNKQSTHFPMQSVCKKLHHVRNNELIFMYDTQRKAKQTFTWFFLAQISQIPTTSKETGQSKLFWWICKTLFLYIFYFPQPLLVAEDSPKFFTWYVERCLFQGSRHKTDTLTGLMLTKCVNAITGNPPDFH